MAGQALTPELAIGHVEELSTDVRAAVLIGADDTIAASEGRPGDRMAELARELFERAEQADVTGGEAPSQVEVTTLQGAVFAVRDARWTLAVVADRLALSSLMFYDLRDVLAQLGPEAA